MNSNDFLNEGIGEDAQAMALDHEVQMARQECYHAAEDAITLHKLLRHMSEQQGLEGWVSAKITLAADYLNTVREHLEYQLMAGAEQPAPMNVVTVAEGTITHEDLAPIGEGFDDFVKGAKRLVKGKPTKGERETHHLLRAVGTAKAGTPGMSGSEKEFIEKEFLKHANRHDKVKNLPKGNYSDEEHPIKDDGNEGMPGKRNYPGMKEATDMMAKERRKRLADAEKKKQERLAAEKAKKKKDVTEGGIERTATGVKHTRDFPEYPGQSRKEFSQDPNRLNKSETGRLDKAFGVKWEPKGNRKEISADPTGVDEGVAEGSETAADIDKKIEFHKQGQAAAQYKGSMNKMHAKKIKDLEAKKQALKQGVAEGTVYDLEKEYGYEKPASKPRRSAPSDYPYSQEQDDAYFREIFRKKREAAKTAEQDKEQGVDETRVGNRMSDMSVGSPKIVYKNGRAVGEIGLDHEASPGNGPYYMKHYETNTWYSGYASKKEALAELKHVVDQMNEDEAKLKAYKRASAGDAINRQNIARHTSKADPKIAKRNAGQERAEKRLSGISAGIKETSAGSVAGVVAPVGKNKAKVGSLFGGTYKQKKAAK